MDSTTNKEKCEELTGCCTDGMQRKEKPAIGGGQGGRDGGRGERGERRSEREGKGKKV